MNHELGIRKEIFGRCRESIRDSLFMIHDSSQKGFSLVETIVAIAILSVAVVAPLTLAQRGLNSSIYAKDQVTAFYLAQEAIEYVHNVRDSNNLKGSGWLFALDKCVNMACGIDVTAPGTVSEQTIQCSSDPAGCKMTYDPTNGIYGEEREGNGNPKSGYQDAIFTRTLQITPCTSGGCNAEAEATVVATVSWKTGTLSRSLSLNELIFNWLPAPLP